MTKEELVTQWAGLVMRDQADDSTPAADRTRPSVSWNNRQLGRAQQTITSRTRPRTKEPGGREQNKA